MTCPRPTAITLLIATLPLFVGCSSLALLGFKIAKEAKPPPTDEAYFKADPDLKEIRTTQSACEVENSTEKLVVFKKELVSQGGREFRYISGELEYACTDHPCTRITPISSVSQKPVILLNTCH